MKLKENAHNDLHHFRRKGFENRLHYMYINTPKQLILDFYDYKNDNFHVKIVIVFCCCCFLAKK